MLSLPLSAISFIRIAAKVSSNNNIRRKQKSKNTRDGTLLRECDDETIIFSAVVVGEGKTNGFP